MSDIEAIKSRLDIVDVIGSYIPLKRAGHSYKAPCPFHKEKTPSFVVTPSMQLFKCFGCGEGGDVIGFIQKIERVDFPEALRLAAERAGYELKQNHEKKDAKILAQIERIYQANELATKYWNYILKTHAAGKPGRDYLIKRAIRMQEVELFGIGYASKGTNLLPFLEKKGFTKAELVSWGLAVEREGKVIDKFRERLMMPIWDLKGKVIGFSGRIIVASDYAPKYINSPETLIYHKGEILMGLYQAATAARKEKTIILQEGNIDLLSSHKVGVNNIVATGGTALTEAQIKLIKRHADKVLFAFDNDEAGVKAMFKGLELAEKLGLEHKVIDFEGFKDPDELILKSPELWSQKVNQPINTVEYIFKIYQRDLDLGNADDKSTFLKRVLPALQVLKDKVQQAHFAKQLAMIVGITPEDVDQLINSTKSVMSALPIAEAEHHPLKEVTGNKREIYLLALLFQLPNPQEMEISAEIFSDVNAKEIFISLMRFGNQPETFAKLADQLSDGASEVLQQVLSTDIEITGNLQAEATQIYKSVYSSYLRSEILNLRRSLQTHPDESEHLTKLNHLTRELKQLSD